MSKRILTFVMLAGLLLTMSADGEDGAVTYSYDEAGRLVSADYGARGVITYVYDAAGNLLQRTVTLPAPEPPDALFSFTPGGPQLRQPVVFTDQSTGYPTSWSWDFGDGSSSDEPSPTHVFMAPGTYSVTLGVTNPSGSDQDTQSVTVGSQVPARAGDLVVIPASAHTAGLGGTFFVTDLRVLNTGSSAVDASLLFYPTGGGERRQHTRRIAAGHTLAIDDVVEHEFGLSSAVGAILISPWDGEVKATSRTFNTAADGTYGQFIAGVPAGDAIGEGAKVHILQVAKSEHFRANVGFVEVDGSAATVRVAMYSDSGAQLGSRSMELGSFEFFQINDVFSWLGVGPQASVRVTVGIVSGSGRVLAYASVIDNDSSDQVYVPGQQQPQTGEPLLISAGASASGSHGSEWRTDIRIANLAASARTVELAYLPRGEDNSVADSRTYTLAAGHILSLDDVIAGEFQTTGNGAFRIDTVPSDEGGLIATSRTYSLSADGTYGQFIPAMALSEAIGADDGPASALQIDRSAAMRTNFGWLNATASSGTLNLSLVSGSGATLASEDYPLLPFSPTQVNDVFSVFEVPWQSNARIDLEVTGNAKVLGYGSVIDNTSNDPFYVIVERWDRGGVRLPDLAPTTPAGWSGAIVVSTTAGTSTDEPPIGGQPAYVDLAVTNQGNAAASAFQVVLGLDGALSRRWDVPGLEPGETWTATDHVLNLVGGSHTLRLGIDGNASVEESDESNNAFERTLTWQEQALPDLAPVLFTDYQSPIVVSNSPGARTTDSTLSAGVTYFSWFAGNTGSAAAVETFLTSLEINGVRRYTCAFSDGLQPGFGSGCVDAVLNVPRGTVVVSTEVDFEDTIEESDESNNHWFVTLVFQ